MTHVKPSAPSGSLERMQQRDSIAMKTPTINTVKRATMKDYKSAADVSHTAKLYSMGVGNSGKPAMADGGSIPPVARKQMIDAARAGKPLVVDPKGTGMTGPQIGAMLERAGNQGRLPKKD
jgi:hypothetical protein